MWRLVTRGFVFGSIWWALGGGGPATWWFGLPAVGIAVAVSLLVTHPSIRLRCSPGGLASFVPFFCIQSLRGGVDVAWRAFHPGLPIHPCLVHYPLRLRDKPARVFMANVVSLLPGTLSADLEGDGLVVHALDGRLPITEQLRALESRVANLFRIALQGP